MRKLLIGLLTLISYSALAQDSNFINTNDSPITPKFIRSQLNLAWKNSPRTLAKIIIEDVQKNGVLHGTATCVSKTTPIDSSKDIVYYIPIAFGMNKETIGPFTREYLTFNATYSNSSGIMTHPYSSDDLLPVFGVTDVEIFDPETPEHTDEGVHFLTKKGIFGQIYVKQLNPQAIEAKGKYVFTAYTGDTYICIL